MTSGVARPGNPYVGPRAFTREETRLFFGRQTVAAELMDILLSERLVLLHSPSGAGKSSLIEAGLVPLLEAEQFRVLPAIRVHTPKKTGAASTVNRYLRSTILSLEGSAPSPIAESELNALTLSAYLNRAEAAERRLTPAEDPPLPPKPTPMIFDQFEEILTADPNDHDGRLRFFREVGEALRARHRWALFAMREEFVASLDPYLAPLPGGLATRFALSLLTAKEAEASIAMPTALGTPPRTFSREALDQLLLNLRTIKSPTGGESRIDKFVEPVHLQVVCLTLWDRLGDDVTEIDASHVAELGDVDKALRDYYAGCVRTASGGDVALEGRIRSWIGLNLITRGRRAQVLHGTEAESLVSPEAINALLATFVIRSEERRNSQWYELGHDRLIDPVQRDNDSWFFASGSGELHVQAELWLNSSRRDSLLLTAEALKEAEAAAEARPEGVTPVLSDFLKRSRDHMRARSVGRLRLALSGAVSVVIVLVGLLSWALQQKAKANALVRELADTTKRLDSTTQNLTDTYRKLGDTGQALRTLAQSRGADGAIKRIIASGQATPTRDTIVYYFKQTDPPSVQTALRDLGFPLIQQTAVAEGLFTNAVSFGTATDVDNVKLVALALLRGGVILRLICPPFRGTGGPHTIQVYGTSRGASNQPLTVEQVRSLKLTDRQLNCNR